MIFLTFKVNSMNLKTVFLTLTLGLSAAAHAELNVKVYQADSNSFNVTSTLVTGEKRSHFD